MAKVVFEETDGIFHLGWRARRCWSLVTIPPFSVSLLESTRKTQIVVQSLCLVLPTLLAANCLYGLRAVDLDIHGDTSESKTVGNLLNSSSQLRNAIVLTEPEHFGEAVPYYAKNDMYLVRERKFGKVASWSDDSISELHLGFLLESAKALKARTGRPIAILMHHRLTDEGAYKTIAAGFVWTFSYSKEELHAFRAATRQLASYRSALTDENFEVYLLE